MIELKNEQLTVLIAETGAELQSIKDAHGNERLWQGDSAYWPRRSPILFPIVCSVNNDTYTVDGHDYHLPRHGFARDSDFRLINKTDTKVTLALESSEQTLNVYPYHFVLSVTYVLDGPKVGVIWHVLNTDKQEIHFQIGGHPAFLVPGAVAGQPLRGRLRIDGDAVLDSLLSHGDGTVELTEVPLETENGIIRFDDEFFANDSVKVHKSQTTRVELLDEEDQAVVTVSYRSPVIAFWSPYQKQAPFVCIEPWYGLGDPVGFTGEFRDKPLMNHLLPGASFMSKYDIIIG